MSETRITNEKTGGQKGQKDEQFSLLPWDVLGEVARLYAFGAKKYSRDNWRKGYDWSLSADALLRHFSAYWSGEDYDMETGEHHLTSVVFHALTLLYFAKAHPKLDDRPKIGE